MIHNRTLPLLVLSALAFAACSKQSTAAPESTMAPVAAAPAQRQKAPDNVTVGFVGIKDGDTVSSPFKVGFSVEGLKVANAGTFDPGTGHFHLIIDSALPPQDGPLPSNGHLMHYGKGQMETDLSLPAGSHTLQIEFADGSHVPFDPPVVSAPITITVK